MIAEQLRLIGHFDEDPDIHVVLIPSVGSADVESWPFHSHRWLRTFLPPEQRRINIWTFDYTFPVDDNFKCENLWVHGERLLTAMKETLEPKESSHEISSPTGRKPILIFCHGLGGIVLKQACCVANAQILKTEHLVNQLAGIIFFSTPHLGSDKAETLEKTLQSLKATSKPTIKMDKSRQEDESRILFDIAIRFSATQLRTPMLSVYELAPTKIREGRFKSRQLFIVDKATCALQAPDEHFLSLPLDHSGIMQFDKCSEEVQQQLREFVKHALSHAEQTMSSRLQAIDLAQWDTATYSPTYSETSSISFVRIQQENDVGSVGRHLSESLTASDTDLATCGDSSVGENSLAHVISALNIKNREPQLPCRLLENEFKNDEFYGRDDILQRMSKALLPSSEKVISSENEGLRQFAVCGLGGLGKTEIATEFTARNQGAFDAVFWIGADDTSKLDTAFSRISKSLGLEDASEGKSHVVSRELVKGWLSRPWKVTSLEGKPTPVVANWLMIFDNADDQFKLTDYWPLQGNGSILLTSRDPLAQSYFTAEPSGVDLAPFSDEDGADLLMKLTRMSGKDDKPLAEKISHMLGGLPLAISQMAGVIRRQDLSLNEFIESYSDTSEQDDMFKTRYPGGRTQYAHTISTVWAFETLGENTSALLGTISMLDPDSIPEFILSDPSAELQLAKFPTKAPAYRRARTELLQASLVKRLRDANEMSIHRLVQDSFRAQMDLSDRAKTFWFAVGLVSSHWPYSMPPPTRRNMSVSIPRLWAVDRWPMCKTLYPHVMKLKDMYEAAGPEELGNPQLKLAHLLQNAAMFQFERGHTREMLSILELALQICNDSDDSDAASVSSVYVDTHFVMGAITAGTNDHDGSVYHHKCALTAQLETREREDALDVRLARCYNELGTGRMEAGDLQGSIEAHLESIRIDIELGVYPHNWVCDANLGLSYTYSGKLEEAEEHLLKIQGLREEKYGKDDRESYRPGRVLHSIARLREGQGRTSEAFDVYSRSLASLMGTLGYFHHFSADCGHKVAQYAIKYQKYDAALKLIDQSLSFYTYEPECYKAEIARATFLHSRLMRLLGKDVKARTLLKKAASLRREIVDSKEDKKPDNELTLGDFDCLVSVMHCGTRCIPKPTTPEDEERLNNLIGPCP